MIRSQWSRSSRKGVFLMGLLLFLSAPAARANPGPPPFILTHVQPLQGVTDPCESPITDCTQIVRNCPYVDFLLFQFFVYGDHEGWDLHSLTASLEWPETWIIESWHPCQAGTMEFNLSPDESACELQMSWPDCVVMPGSPFLVFSLLFYVGGPGEIRFREDTQWISWFCPQGMEEPMVGIGAIAGTDCDYTNYMCGDDESCVAELDVPEVRLTAPVGGRAESDVWFSAGHYCSFWLDTVAWWLSGTVHASGQPGRYVLHLVADAGHTPGIYQTWAQVESSWSARCLPVTFEVEGTSSVGDLPVREQVGSWGRIKSSYRD